MHYKYTKEFRESLSDLYQKSGPYQKAAERVQAAMYRYAEEGYDLLKSFKVTKHGESRIKKCFKYDLTSACRLITIIDSGVVLICFVGDHDKCDQWLNKNRGSTLIKTEEGQIEIIQRTSDLDKEIGQSVIPGALIKGKLFENLPETYFDQLVLDLPRTIVRKLENLESIHEEQEIYEIAETVEDTDQGEAIFDVFRLLRLDDRGKALDRIKLYLGEACMINQLTEEQIRELADSKNIKSLRADDPRFKDVFEYFVKNSNFMDWMLFLHPDQENIVNDDFSGPTKLSGVSGSGKTCIVVKRAIRLAEKYRGEKILVLTLNRQLAQLITSMVDACCLPNIRDSIEVMPFFSLCQQLLHKFEPENDKLYDDITWKSKEHVDEIWREFYRCELNSRDAEIFIPLHDSLLGRRINPEMYIREEIDWIRSAVPSYARNIYTTIKREGRGIPLDQKFREIMLQGLTCWEKKMKFVGVTDYLGLSAALHRHKSKVKNIYRSVIVDEAQDFGTIELELIRKLVGERENDMFLCGDIAQQVSAKHLSFGEAGINIPSTRALKIEKNYRNSREILTAAYDVWFNNLTDEMLDSKEFEILDPKHANFSAAAPLMLQADSLEEEIASGIKFIRNYLEGDKNKKGCLAMSGYSIYQVQRFGIKNNIKVLDGEITIETDNIYLSDLEHTKGFEFDVVVIVNCSKSVMPDMCKPEKERFRDLSKLYVSMTRAKDQLVLSYSNEPSDYIDKAKDNLLDDKWNSYVDENSLKLIGKPPSLNQIRAEGEKFERRTNDEFLEMTGAQVLYTHHGLYMSIVLIEKTRKLISGRSVYHNRVAIEWKTIGAALKDIQHEPRSRAAFGTGEEGLNQFREFFKKYEAPNDPESKN